MGSRSGGEQVSTADTSPLGSMSDPGVLKQRVTGNSMESGWN